MLKRVVKMMIGYLFVRETKKLIDIEKNDFEQTFQN